MKKLFKSFVAAATLALVATGLTTPVASANDKVIKLSVAKISAVDEIVEVAKKELEKDGYTLEVKQFSDYTAPNDALFNKEVDANLFQHKPFMEGFNKGKNANLVHVQPVYNFLGAFYGKDVKKIEDLKDGAKVAVPNDPFNFARSLKLLEKAGLIKLKDSSVLAIKPDEVDQHVTKVKDINIEPASLATIGQKYQEADLVFDYPSSATKYTKVEDAVLAEETPDPVYALGLAAREDNKDSDAVKALQKALTSESVKNLLKEKAVNTPAF
ncbi:MULTISPECIES: MetQ/NlpA family ABC transporter substrate-binding protein [unclassified Gemella]|uniref:MetQ/NlpA family ABC transporter substrate-binding protein n=1 Tax=unclassified Gemella TaxID=2624949 RepID=UPI001073137A|nr:MULTISPECIES: MetQ/NlpA family ABC transporter substrate-binding protein [unclassified Gemella]MBF0710042.1 hypothetical protein [Gemella sp. GL1.1]MBF0746121.1 hypothetical protein [Gemella sp. 19428wG2_WT2a]NYS27386.1 hypothetical protein [Gemella sp. GL1]TFU60410.1 hypothetical protein E4T67_00280 [Gemella sp. WT2a]